MSEQPKKRPWLQFHLSTAVVLMFVASGLLWLNMRPHQCLCSLPEVGAGATGLAVYYGWPWPAWVSGLEDDASGERANYKAVVAAAVRIAMDRTRSFVAGVADALLALGIMASAAVSCEWRIRRRERRQ